MHILFLFYLHAKAWAIPICLKGASGFAISLEKVF
jgi:hypothetical protein